MKLVQAPEVLAEIRTESRRYVSMKINKVPPADSPTRPALACLWAAAHRAVGWREADIDRWINERNSTTAGGQS